MLARVLERIGKGDTLVILAHIRAYPAVNTEVKVPRSAEVIFPGFGYLVTSHFMRLCYFPFWACLVFWAVVAV